MRHRNRLVGFTYDEAAGVAHFSMYVPGTAGRDRKRATVTAATYEDAVRLWSEFRSRAAEGIQLRRPDLSVKDATIAASTLEGVPVTCPSLLRRTASSGVRDAGTLVAAELHLRRDGEDAAGQVLAELAEEEHVQRGWDRHLARLP